MNNTATATQHIVDQAVTDTTRLYVAKTGASMKRGKSKQDYATPDDFIKAVVGRFGGLSFDLAASLSNAKAPALYDEVSHSLTQDWNALSGNLWLNPPFDDIAPWAKKCGDYIPLHVLIVEQHLGRFLNWFGPSNPRTEVVHHKNLRVGRFGTGWGAGYDRGKPS